MPKLVYLVVLACLLRLAILIPALENRRYSGDSSEYDALATTLLHSWTFSTEAGPETFRAPGYPLFLAFIYAPTRNSHLAVILLQVFINVGLVYSVALLASKWWHPRAGLVAATFMASDLTSILYTVFLLSETLFTFLFLVSVSLAARWQQSQRLKVLALAAFVAGLATLVRAVAFYWPLVLAGYVAWYTRKTPTRMGVSLLTLALAYSIVVGPWMVRNYTVAGTWQVATVQSANLVWFRAAGTVMRRDGVGLQKAREKLRSTLGTTRSRERHFNPRPEEVQFALRVMLAYPLATLSSTLHGLGATMFGPGIETWAMILGQVPRHARLALLTLGMLLLVLSYIGALYGLWRGWRSPDHYILTLLTLAILYILLISAGPEAYSRFRTPIMPLIALLAGYGWHRLFYAHTTYSRYCHRFVYRRKIHNPRVAGEVM